MIAPVTVVFAVLTSNLFELYATTALGLVWRCVVVASFASLALAGIAATPTGGAVGVVVMILGPGLAGSIGLFIAFDAEFPDDVSIVLPFAVAYGLTIWVSVLGAAMLLGAVLGA